MAETVYCQKVNAKIEANCREARGFSVFPSSEFLFLIRAGSSSDQIVNINIRTCSCLQFQQLKFPCAHASAAIFYSKQNIYDFVANEYANETLRQLYSIAVDPVLVNNLIIQPILPPIVRRQSGRPKKVRIRSRNEGLDSNITCSLCQQSGHNKRTCTRRSSQPTRLFLNYYSLLFYVQ